MELLTYPKTDYLLDASLETLHAESREWLKEMDFWSDEMAFFYKLLHKKFAIKEYPAADLAEIEKELIRINSDHIERMKRKVQSHEQALASVLKTTSIKDEDAYRATHRMLLNDIYSTHLEIKNFKGKIFSFVHNYD